jgi:YesN/AraC family two-component response regulator
MKILNQPLSLNSLSEHLYISKYYLSVLFKKATGFSINEYIIAKRIARARELLKTDTACNYQENCQDLIKFRITYEHLSA